MSRNEATAKPSFTRRPLRELSNIPSTFGTGCSDSATCDGSRGVRVSKLMLAKQIAPRSSPDIEETKEDDGDCLDRLLVVHSDLSSLTRQIDDLVARTFKLKSAGKDGRREIESFSQFLSNTLSSLKPWVSRFEKALATPSLEMEKQLQETPAEKLASAVNEGGLDNASPEESEMNTLISPSPLVSWRKDCNIGRSRQLFLLTPLPMSKSRELSARVLENMVSGSRTEPSSFLAISGDDNDDLLEGMKMNPTPSKSCGDYVAPEVKNNNECGLDFSTPMTTSKRDHPSMMVMTPCLKMSPPKSCLLLEPIAEMPRTVNCSTRQSTPYPVGIHSQMSESESSGSEGYEDLGVRYPELLGIQLDCKSGIGNKDLDKSPDWYFSPPKTCVLLQPSDENSVAEINQVVKSDDQVQRSLKQERAGSSFQKVVSTPAWEGTVRRGGKHPGENTLKRELWTKFEAVTSCGVGLVSSSGKGFLDMLDEVSCEEQANQSG
ncbi:hypothetical protein LINGRAHAP2_LOCUS7465 [Linum grandiflorum]